MLLVALVGIDFAIVGDPAESALFLVLIVKSDPVALDISHTLLYHLYTL
jgi:hypothetical protein